MKPIEEMLKAPRIIIGERGEDGFQGEIQMPGWRGSIVASWGGGWEHVSVAPYKRHILPSWDDMCYIKDLFWNKDECVVQYHPPKSEYVDMVPNCLHLWRPVEEPIPMPPSIMVGIRKGQSVESIRQEIKDIEGRKE